MILRSSFEDGSFIPVRHTCDGGDHSPPLFFEDYPYETKSLALVCHTKDRGSHRYIHWLLYEIDPVLYDRIPESLPRSPTILGSVRQGFNDKKKLGYNGPCPKGGIHRYYFKAFALNQKLFLPPAMKPEELLDALKDHIIDTAELMGHYQR